MRNAVPPRHPHRSCTSFNSLFEMLYLRQHYSHFTQVVGFNSLFEMLVNALNTLARYGVL